MSRRCARAAHARAARSSPVLTLAAPLSQAVVKTVDMGEEMEKDCIEFTTYALNEYMVEKEMTNYIKRELDKKYR